MDDVALQRNARFPHTRGGEPSDPDTHERTVRVFPTHVGVNRGKGMDFGFTAEVFPTHVGVNRATVCRATVCRAFSPHMWG